VILLVKEVSIGGHQFLLGFSFYGNLFAVVSEKDTFF
jgi:hypothetical protein